MVEYFAWIRPQHAQRKWDACNRQSQDQKWARSSPACRTSRSRLPWPSPRRPGCDDRMRGGSQLGLARIKIRRLVPVWVRDASRRDAQGTSRCVCSWDVPPGSSGQETSQDFVFSFLTISSACPWRLYRRGFPHAGLRLVPLKGCPRPQLSETRCPLAHVGGMAGSQCYL